MNSQKLVEVPEVIRKISWYQIFWSIVFIVLAYVLWCLVKKFRDRLFARFDAEGEDSVRKKSLATTVCNFIKYVIIVLCGLTVLQMNGINVTSILAGLGIAGAIAGLAWQDMFKDLIQGVRIMTDSFYSAGDYIQYNGEIYQVTEFSLRTTRLKSLANNDTVTLCNRNVSEVRAVSGTQNLIVNLPYEADVALIDGLLTSAAAEIDKLKGVKSCKYLGLRTFEDSSIGYQLSMTTSPRNYYSMRRAANRIIKETINKAGLEVPYTQLDIHQK